MPTCKQDNPFMYFHRIGRIYNFLQSVETIKGRRSEFLHKSYMMGSLFSFNHATKLLFEGGILSLVPQYAEKDQFKLIQQNFGTDVKNLVAQAEGLRREFVSGSPSANELKGYCLSAKNINLYATYIDLVHALSQDSGKVHFEGQVFVITETGVKIGNKIHTTQKFHQFLMDIVSWKLEILDYTCANIQQCLREIIRQYKDQKGFLFNLADGKFSYEDGSQQETEIGVSTY